jgi:hypothetical protein
MPTVLTHAVAALGLGAAFFGRTASVRVLGLGAVVARPFGRDDRRRPRNRHALAVRHDPLLLPFRPIEVSPIGVRQFFSERGLTVLASEMLWVWLPSAVLAGWIG